MINRSALEKWYATLESPPLCARWQADEAEQPARANLVDFQRCVVFLEGAPADNFVCVFQSKKSNG